MSGLSERSRAVLLEAADTLLEDIGNGRQWGFDEEAHEENAERLAEARDELRELTRDGEQGGEP